MLPGTVSLSLLVTGPLENILSRMLRSINTIRRWRETALDIILPPTCSLCGGAPETRRAKFCEECLDLLAVHRSEHVCARCAMPLPQKFSTATVGAGLDDDAAISGESSAVGDAAKPEDDPQACSGRPRFPRCYHCRKQTFVFQRALAYGFYEGTLREAVIATKQSAQAPLTLALGELLGESLRPQLASHFPDRVVAVPAHWTRRMRRGGVPSQWLAESVGRTLGIRPVQTLRCIRHTRKQGTLPPEKRAENVRGAFRAKRGYAFGASDRAINGMHLLLVDDVLTTGSTGNAAASALRAAGARRVTLAVLARATG